MIVDNLNNELIKHLNEAVEIYIAVALTKEIPLKNLLKKIPVECKQEILIGVDLPTTTNALELLKNKCQENNNIKSRIYYDETTTFHPKIYLIRKKNQWIGFVGSANLTEGGLSENIELSYQFTDEKQCQELLTWFKTLFANSFPIDKHNIQQFKKESKRVETPRIEKKVFKFKKNENSFNQLDEFDFTDRFFKKEHHWAFRKEIWISDTEESISERENVEQKFVELHNIIYHQFKKYGIQNLEPNPTKGHLLSMIRQIDRSFPRSIDAMWLSYGKSNREIKAYQKLVGPDQSDKQTFIHHSRLQIRLELLSIGIWLLFGKENKGSLFDRGYFRGEMNNPNYRSKFFKELKSLANEYWIEVNGDKRLCSSFNSEIELHDFCKRDNEDRYFIIGRDYKINDIEMSQSNLPNETLKVFKLLFPLYEMMTHRLS